MYKVEEIKARLTPVFGANGVKSAILFGSYAKGTASEKSDVDLLVDSGLRGLSFIGLRECVCEALGMDVDVFDIGYLKKNSHIDNEIRQTGVRIYG